MFFFFFLVRKNQSFGCEREPCGYSCFFIMTRHIDGVTPSIQLVSKSTLILLGTYFQIPVFSTSFDHSTGYRILLDATENNGTSYFNKGFYRKGIRKNQRTRGTKKQQKNADKKNPRVGLNPSYRIRYLLRGAVPSLLTTQTWRYFCRRYHRWRYFFGQ